MEDKKMKRVIFGYNAKQVENCIKAIEDDYEDELTKKQDRMLKLIEENRGLKQQIKELEAQIVQCREQEGYIAKALVKAEKKAQDIIDAGHRKVREEYYKMEMEKQKWKERTGEIRRQMLDFERVVCETLEGFRAEINYLTSKEISEALLEEIEDTEDADGIRSVS